MAKATRKSTSAHHGNQDDSRDQQREVGHEETEEAASLVAISLTDLVTILVPILRGRGCVRLLGCGAGVHRSGVHKSNLHRLCRNGESCKATGIKRVIGWRRSAALNISIS